VKLLVMSLRENRLGGTDMDAFVLVKKNDEGFWEILNIGLGGLIAEADTLEEAIALLEESGYEAGDWRVEG